MAVLPEGHNPEKPTPSRDALQLALWERVPGLVWTTDLQSRVTSVSGALRRAIAVPSGEYAGKSVDLLLPSPDSSHTAVYWHQRAIDGHPCSFEATVNGRSLHASLEAFCEPDGAVGGVVGIAVDLTDRLVTERALRLSEQSYRSLIEEAPYAICRSTVSGQLLQVNRAMIEILGYDSGSEAELLIRDLPLIFASPDDFLSFREALLRGQAAVQGTEALWIDRASREVQVRVGGRAMRDRNGEISYFDVVAENITEKKHLEAQLSQAQKMQAIGQLAGGTAHDFNNLLTVISGHLEIVIQKDLDPALRQRLAEVKEAAERATVLTRQLLAFSRRQVLQSKVVDLNQVIGQFIGMLGRLIKENVELKFHPAPLLASVRADANQIERVLMNLAVNAQDAMPQGGRLAIETTNVRIDSRLHGSDDPDPGEYVQIAVRDTGHGMDRQTITRIFDPFFTTKKAGEGTGLGLSMVYGVVRQSGGHIRVESKPGEGSTFRIYLPAVAGASQPQHIVQTPGTPPRGCETILYAEDDHCVRVLFAGYLKTLGYRVLTATDGQEALDLARHHTGSIHLLLSDLVMPNVGGRELAAELRRTDPELKVIFVSGYAGHEVASNELDRLEGHFLAKPVSLELLAKTVREVLDGLPG
jgi:two-component system cell cycle sensor histidine kinase/response regulator CckA